MTEANRNFPANLSEIENVYEFISQVITKNNIDSTVGDLLKMATDEIFSNIVNHAFKDMRQGTMVGVAVRVEDGAISMTFRDRGTPFDPLSIASPDISSGLEERPVGGLGIHIVKNMFDGVHYAFVDGFNVFTLKKLLGKAN